MTVANKQFKRTESYDHSRKKKGLMSMVCTEDELNAIYCERENMDKLTSCIRKVLNLFSGDRLSFFNMPYEQFVSQWRQDYTTDNELIVKMFPKV